MAAAVENSPVMNMMMNTYETHGRALSERDTLLEI